MVHDVSWFDLIRRRFSQKTRARAAVCLLAAGTVAVLGSVAYLAWRNHRAFERAMVSQAQRLLLTIARAEAQSLEEYIENVRQELDILSTDPAMRKGFWERYLGVAGDGQSALEESYRDVQRLADAIFLIDSRGRVMRCSPPDACAAGQDLSRATDVAAALVAHRAFVSEIFTASSSTQAVSLLQPVVEGKVFIGLLRAVISLERIHSLVSPIDRGKSVYAFVLDGHGMIVSYPDTALIGRDFVTALHAQFPGLDMGALREGVRAMEGGGEGMHIIRLPSGGSGPGTAGTLVAFTPIRIGASRWSIVIAMDYRSIAGPLRRNLRDNFLFVTLVIAVLGALGTVVYRARRKHAEFAVSTRALHIINRQLHLEIEERRRIASSLNEAIHGRGGRGRQ